MSSALDSKSMLDVLSNKEAPVVHEGAKSGQDDVAKDFPSLRRIVRHAEPGTGRVTSALLNAEFSISERDITVLIVTCRKRNEWRKANEIFDSVKLVKGEFSPMAPNFYTFSAIISICVKAGALPVALQRFREMQAAAKADPELEPDASHYMLLIGAATSQGDNLLATELYKEAMMASLELEASTLLQVVESCMIVKEWSTALSILDHICGLDEWQGNLEREWIKEQYLFVLEACGESGDVNLAVEVLLTVQMIGFELDVWMGNSVMRAAEMADDVETGIGLFCEMVESRVQVATTTKSSLLRLLLKTGNLHQARNLAGLMDTAWHCGLSAEPCQHVSNQWAHAHMVYEHAC